MKPKTRWAYLTSQLWWAQRFLVSVVVLEVLAPRTGWQTPHGRTRHVSYSWTFAPANWQSHHRLWKLFWNIMPTFSSTNRNSSLFTVFLHLPLRVVLVHHSGTTRRVSSHYLIPFNACTCLCFHHFSMLSSPTQSCIPLVLRCMAIEYPVVPCFRILCN